MFDLLEYRVRHGLADMYPTVLGSYDTPEQAQKAKENRKIYVRDTAIIIKRAIKNHEPEQEIRNYVQCLQFDPFSVKGYRIIEHPEPKQKFKMRNRKVSKPSLLSMQSMPPGSVSDRPKPDWIQPKLWGEDLWTEQPWC